MEIAEAVRDFKEVCLRVLHAIARRPPTKEEAWELRHFCKTLLSQIEPYLPKQSSNGQQSPKQ